MKEKCIECGRRHRQRWLAYNCFKKQFRFNEPWYILEVIECLGWDPHTAQDIQRVHHKVNIVSLELFSPARTFDLYVREGIAKGEISSKNWWEFREYERIEPALCGCDRFYNKKLGRIRINHICD